MLLTEQRVSLSEETSTRKSEVDGRRKRREREEPARTRYSDSVGSIAVTVPE